MSYTLKTCASPSKDHGITNRVYINSTIPLESNIIQIEHKFYYAVEHSDNVDNKHIALNSEQRKALNKILDQNVEFVFVKDKIDFAKLIEFNVISVKPNKFNCEELTEKIKLCLGMQPLSINQTIAILLTGTVIFLNVLNIQNDMDSTINCGIFHDETDLNFSTLQTHVTLTNQQQKARGNLFKKEIILSDLGIGGLGEQFGKLFRAAFSSRVKPEIAKMLGINHVRGILLYGPPGCGKCLGKDTSVLMFDGSIKLVQDIIVGDLLMGDDSTSRTVLSLARGKEMMYKIGQDYGDDYVVNESHILSLQMTRKTQIKKTKTSFKAKYFDVDEMTYRQKTFKSTFEIDKKKGKINKNEQTLIKNKIEKKAYNEAINYINKMKPVNKIDICVKKYLKSKRDVRRALKGYKVGVEFENKLLKIDPYFVGLYLASRDHNVTDLNDVECNILQEYLNVNFGINSCTFTDGKLNIEQSIINMLHEHHIFDDCVPDLYKMNTMVKRRRILAGIIDFAGDHHKGEYRLSIGNKKLADDILYICKSLGYRSSSNYVIDSQIPYYRIKFSGTNVNLIPIFLEKNKVTKNKIDQLYSTITLEQLQVDDYYGFEIDGNHRFLLGDFTVTHNTLIARQIGKVLKCIEPKIVNGPEVLAGIVGESEKNIRNLFADAENDNDENNLHLIIFDEMDAICKQRGSSRGDTGVSDRIVTQLLSKIDGVDSLNNILIIGMTNRKDLIDEALLRPGRFEVHIEINLPDENGRYEILNIHTATMKTNNCLDSDVDLKHFASETKNYTGAEIEGFVKSASSFAISRDVYIENGKVNTSALTDPKVTVDDFNKALNEIKPMFGKISDEINLITHSPFVLWTQQLKEYNEEIGQKIIDLNYGNMSKLLITGSASCGKTKFIAHLAKNTGISCIRLITPENLLKVQDRAIYITNIFDQCSKAEEAVIILDGFERIIEWSALGCRFNNTTLQTIMSLLNLQCDQKNKITVIVTANKLSVLDDLEISCMFDKQYDYPEWIKSNEIDVHFPKFEHGGIEHHIADVFKFIKYV
jgi:SpoVK/Ycf46/Vps4 family AAA+-type ATPase